MHRISKKMKLKKRIYKKKSRNQFNSINFAKLKIAYIRVKSVPILNEILEFWWILLDNFLKQTKTCFISIL